MLPRSERLNCGTHSKTRPLACWQDLTGDSWCGSVCCRWRSVVLDRESLQVSWWRTTRLLKDFFCFSFCSSHNTNPLWCLKPTFPGRLRELHCLDKQLLCFSPRLLDFSFLSWWAWKLCGACQVIHPKVNVSMLLVEHYNISQYDMFTNLIIWPCLYFSSLSKWCEYLLHQLAIRILSPRWFTTRCKHKITCLAKWMQLVHHGHTDNPQVGLKPNLLFIVRLVS